MAHASLSNMPFLQILILHHIFFFSLKLSPHHDYFRHSLTCRLEYPSLGSTQIKLHRLHGWSFQFRTLLTGYGLLGYINGSDVPPPSTITIYGLGKINLFFRR